MSDHMANQKSKQPVPEVAATEVAAAVHGDLNDADKTNNASNLNDGVPSVTAGGPIYLGIHRILILVGLAVVTFALLIGLGGGRAALVSITEADPFLLLLAALIHYSGFAVRGHRWQLLLRSSGFRLGYLYTTGLLISGWFLSALLPARAGDLLRIGVLRLPPEDPDSSRPIVPVADSLGTIVLERALDILAILLLGAFFGMTVLRDRLPPWVLNTYLIAGGLLLIFGTALLIAPPLLDLLRRLWDRSFWQSLLNFVEQVVTSLRALANRPALGAAVLGESLYIWLCDALLLWLVLAALGEWAPFGVASFIALTVDIIAAIPVTPGGIGQIESAYAGLLALLIRSPLSIAAVVVTVRLISYWSFLAVSGVVTFAAGFGAALRSRPQPQTVGSVLRDGSVSPDGGAVPLLQDDTGPADTVTR